MNHELQAARQQTAYDLPSYKLRRNSDSLRRNAPHSMHTSTASPVAKPLHGALELGNILWHAKFQLSTLIRFGDNRGFQCGAQTSS